MLAAVHTHAVTVHPIALLVYALVGLALYLLPLLVALNRNHHNTTAIGVVNVVLGWTLIGWLAALVWAFSEAHHEVPQAARQRPHRTA